MDFIPIHRGLAAACSFIEGVSRYDEVFTADSVVRSRWLIQDISKDATC